MRGKAATLARLEALREAQVLPAVWVGAKLRGAGARALRALDGHPHLIVRSSAATEDGAKASLAGHFTSVLCEATVAAVDEALERAFAHGLDVFQTLLKRRGETAAAARRRGSRDLGFFVQPALAAEASCVFFAQSPLHPGRALISANFGTCHSVVDGSLACDTFALRGEVVESKRVVHKFEMTWLHHGGSSGEPIATPLGPSWLHQPYEPLLWSARVPRGLNDAPALDDGQLARVARVGAEVQRRLGYAPDLELSFRGGELYLLQARPITTAAPVRPIDFDAELQIASSGTASGPVRVVRSLDDAARVKKGDVIAVGATDPEYLPMLRKAAAVLSEEGSALTHTAIVARELGVPCLVGVTGATTGRFTDGQQVTVDAWRGHVGTKRERRPRQSKLPSPERLAASGLVAEVAYRLGSAAYTAAAGALLGRRRARWDCAECTSVDAAAWRRHFAKGRR